MKTMEGLTAARKDDYYLIGQIRRAEIFSLLDDFRENMTFFRDLPQDEKSCYLRAQKLCFEDNPYLINVLSHFQNVNQAKDYILNRVVVVPNFNGIAA